jgi:excinuclease UvrABC ATPase subunit
VLPFAIENKLYSLNSNEEICPKCKGDGKIWDPDDPPDIIEGNKLRNIIQCPECKGKKTGDFSIVWFEKYFEAKKNAKIKYNFCLAKNIERQRILAKLTPEEQKFLGLSDK